MLNHRPQGRMARPEASSREGRYWDTEFETIFSLPDNSITTKTDYFNVHGLTSKLGHEVINQVYARRFCEECHKVGQLKSEIQSDHRGYAHCPICSTIFNDGKPPIRERTSKQLLKVSAIRRQNYKVAVKKLAKQ
jgi:hypothetical protein